MDEYQMLKIVEQYVKGTTGGEFKITRVPDMKTVFVEQIGDMGRSIIMNSYKVDGKTYWAGYSSRSSTIFISFGSSS